VRALRQPFGRFERALVLVVAGALLAGCGNAGLPWVSQPTTAPLSREVTADGTLREVRLLTPTTGWVLTDNRLLISRDTGKTWVDVTPPSSSKAPLETAFFLNPSMAWAVVRSSEVNTDSYLAPLDLFTSSDGGRRWNATRMPASIPIDTPGPVYLTFVDTMQGWLVVDQGSHSGFMKYTGFRTTDGGRTWGPQSYPQSAPVLFINPIDGFSVGDDDGPGSRAYGTHDGGRTWARLPLPPAGSKALSKRLELPVFSDDRHGVLGGEVFDPYGGPSAVVFYTTSDAGRSWSPAANLPNPTPETSAQPVGIVKGKIWLAAFLGRWPITNRTYTRLKATEDGGRTWKWIATAFPGAFARETSFAGSTGWAIIVDAGCRGFKTDCFTNFGLFQTTDAGTSWQQLPVA
jgi:photosystem II stability/assembly factor-like uncharacterized protein